MTDERKFDIILWGATSFVGKLVAAYLQKRSLAGANLRWCIAGRNPEKLELVKKSLGSDAEDLPILVGDSFDHEFLTEMASQSKVVLTTVGPYLRYGEPLLQACAAQGTDYCDLTGEIPFVRTMMDRYGELASQSGARIVNCAGFDSLPSDLGVLHLHQFAEEKFGSGLKSVEMQVRKAKGGFSGGTVASAIEGIKQVRRDPSLQKLLSNPYVICPESARTGVRQPNLFAVKRSRFSGHWLHHFVMAPVNSKVVHATNAYLNYPFGKDFEYGEWQTAPNALTAHIARIVLAGFFLALYFPLTRDILTKFVLPKPGEGPSREERESGFFHLYFNGLTTDGAKVCGRVTGDADPGYGSTAKQISEVAIGLADSHGQGEGGFGTPASTLGLRLIKPLTEHAGMTFETWEGHG